MKYLSLSGTWALASCQNPETVHKGTIPGSVYSFLIQDGSIEDPFWRDNELESMPLMCQDWAFSREFEVPSGFLSPGRLELDCEGLDTLCSIYINNVLAGEADNMHRHWVYDVTGVVKEGLNTISVVFSSPVNYIKARDKEERWGGTIHAMQGFPYLRKAHCMFGWDWGPRLPDMGIWKEVRLVSVDTARITGFRVTQRHAEGKAEIAVAVEQEGEAEVELSLTAPDGTVISATDGCFTVSEPELWWPNGLGRQPLYTLEAKLLEGGKAVDTLSKRIGLRTMGLTRRKDQWGESFSHCVNGVDFFAMGADYIPEDNIFSRMTAERTRELLYQCKLANFNAVRVWGGGCYPSDAFYDACDEFGLVVWQDMMFACANYPIDYPGFEESITEEIKDNVRRLRHHASLGLWCGNNEMEQYATTDKYDANFKSQAAYIRMYEHIIPHILRTEDPVTPYWPSSPSSGGNFDNPLDPDRGDSHCWDVWHGRVPFSAYRQYFFRYASEFGFQSFPSMASIKEFTLPEDRNIFSRVMETHQRNEGANGLIMTYLSKNYLYPSTLDKLVYASQLLQAEAMKYGVEHWRRNRGRCMGAIYWQLNDIWPVASWASIDYYGRWKALHYFAKRFFEPVHLSCEEHGESQDKDSIIEEPHGPVPVYAFLNVTNETQGSFSGTVRWQLRTASGEIEQEGSVPVEVPALSSMWLDKLDFGNEDFLEKHLSYQLESGGERISEGTVLFTEPKYYHWHDPALKLSREGGFLVIEASSYAKSVEIYSDEGTFLLEDNYFDLEPGTRRVRVLREDGCSFALRSVYDIR